MTERYTVEPYTAQLFSGATVIRYTVRTPGGHALFDALGSVRTYKHRSSAQRKARQLNEWAGLTGH